MVLAVVMEGRSHEASLGLLLAMEVPKRAVLSAMEVVRLFFPSLETVGPVSEDPSSEAMVG